MTLARAQQTVRPANWGNSVTTRHSPIRTRPERARRPRAPQERVAAKGAANFPVVAIGASAGGLEAFRTLLAALPAETGMAFILVQHLDPTHASMMVELLSPHTAMTVLEAREGVRLEPDHVYVIPPGRYLAVRDGALHLSRPQARQAVRMPFDFLLQSLAEEFGERAVCIILSGTGTDGSVGAKAIKEAGGLVIAQDPEEAEYDGMPRSAIATGAVDLVLPLAKIPEALARYGGHRYVKTGESSAALPLGDALTKIIDLLRKRTSHDFALYKEGTLGRRIERRMALAGIEDGNRYLELLTQDAAELQRLADDLLINVTRFFRDAKAFELLAEKIVPEFVRAQPPDRPIRIWVAGCSTGEEAYSIAMLFLEEIASGAAKHEAADLRHGYRRGRGRVRPRRALPAVNRGGCAAGAADPLLRARKIMAIGCRASCARRSSSPSMIWWPMRRSRVST